MNRLFTVLLLAVFTTASAQENLTYQKPPKEILDLVDVQYPPSVFADDKKEYMIFLSRNAYKSIAELSEDELRLGGLRINPKTNIGSRTNYYNKLEIKKLTGKDQNLKPIAGMPENPRMSNFSWSPDQTKLAFTHTTSTGVEAWVIDMKTAAASKLTDAKVNANMRGMITWFRDGQSMLIKMIPADRKELIDAGQAIPTGPTITVNDGKKAQNRTYQDLLKNKTDEFNFEQLARAELVKVSLDGTSEPWMGSDMYSSIQFSPDGNYVMIRTIQKPFSYLVPYYRFPSKTAVYDNQGKLVSTLIEVPLIEDLPKGFMAVRTGKRGFQWRDDRPATLIYSEALDGGDPATEVDYRDEVFTVEAPFDGKGKSIIKTINRFSGITWGSDNIALASDYWWNTRNTKTYLFDPSNSSVTPKVVYDLNYQDRYSDPGSFVMAKNKYDKYVLALKGTTTYLIGDGYSEKGQFPFLDQLDLKTLKTKRLYQSKYTDKLENLSEFYPKTGELLVRIESPSEYPNYYFRKLSNGKLNQITNFENPFKSIQNVEKQVLNYKREDGLDLSGTLYLPVGYDKTKKEKMPMIIWAYPREYKDKSSASQSTQNSNEFTFPWYGGPLYWVTRGYVVLDDASFPIVGEGDEEPNDTFRPQLVSNAKAAIDAVDELGYIDRNRVAVGGHSYGAFMVANLLSHSNLFAGGIARSGAYNRTLTPFGFQSEERNYWEAPDVYYKMSPFMHAEKMKTPLLLIHGEADNNSGTYPLQSERYFNALKGLGATVRLVMLPKESHGYRAKESILHLLWEQDQWLEKHVKNRKMDDAPSN